MDNIISQVREKAEELLAGSALFLVDIKIKPTNNVKVFIDGDMGVTIDAVSKINRALYKQLEESNLFPDGDFSLEVSSPGVDEPLRFIRQYKKNIGRSVSVTLQDDRLITGILKSADDEEITIEEKKGKKKETQECTIPLNNIKTTIVQVTF